MIKQYVFMANVWALTAKGGYGGLGIIGQSDVFPSYYTYQMYSMFGSDLLYSASGIENVSIYAARREDGTITLMIVNLNDEAQIVPLQFKARAPSTAQLFVLTPEHNAQDMGNITLPADGNVPLPGQSVSLFVIPPW